MLKFVSPGEYSRALVVLLVAAMQNTVLILAVTATVVFITESNRAKAERDAANEPYASKNSQFFQIVHLLKSLRNIRSLASGPINELQ